MPERDPLDDIQKLFNLSRKRDVEKFASTILLTKDALFRLIVGTKYGAVPGFYHEARFVELVPEHLKLGPNDRLVGQSDERGVLNRRGAKTLTKIQQIFEDRRVLAVHTFFEPTHTHWHLVYFDQRDQDPYDNHWKHGPHVHYTSDLISPDSLERIWELVHESPPKLPKSIHIRFHDPSPHNTDAT